MTGSLTERYDDRIAGVLSCYDRVVVTGSITLASNPFTLALGPNMASTVDEVYTLIDGPGTAVGPLLCGNSHGSTSASG